MRRYLYDPDDVTCLGNGWHAVMAYDPDGAAHPWLLSPAGDDAPQGCAAHVPHEQLGRLPRAVRGRINPCHASVVHGPRRGQPCPQPAETGERYCGQHAHRSANRGGP